VIRVSVSEPLLDVRENILASKIAPIVLEVVHSAKDLAAKHSLLIIEGCPFVKAL